MNLLQLKLKTKKSIAALNWITDILMNTGISFQITGGLASKVYGSMRPLADIDIDIETDNQYFIKIEKDIARYLVSGPAPYQEEYWKLSHFIIINYHGQMIELCGAQGGFYWHQASNSWMSYQVDFSTSQYHLIENRILPVVDKHKLISYKRALNRTVDLIDIQAMLNNHSNSNKD